MQFLCNKSLGLWQTWTLINGSQLGGLGKGVRGQANVSRTGRLEQIVDVDGYIWSYVYMVAMSGDDQ